MILDTNLKIFRNIIIGAIIGSMSTTILRQEFGAFSLLITTHLIALTIFLFITRKIVTGSKKPGHTLDTILSFIALCLCILLFIFLSFIGVIQSLQMVTILHTIAGIIIGYLIATRATVTKFDDEAEQSLYIVAAVIALLFTGIGVLVALAFMAL